VCGSDLMKSGDALVSLFKNGVDKSRKIIESSGILDSDIDVSYIEKIRQNVQLIDMRGREGEVPGKVLELSKTEAEQFMEPVFMTQLETKPATIITDEAAFKVRGSIDDAWLKILDVIMKFGAEKETEYKIRQREIIDLTAVIDCDSGNIAPWMKIGENDLQNYYATFFGREKPPGVTYTYGNRLMGYPLPDGSRFDQIEHAVEHLKKTPHTRRAIAFTWNVGTDKDVVDPPCITQIVWSVKNGKLYETATIRSNDMFGAWPLNAYALRKMQKEIASKLGVGIGDLIIISNSAHIYENDWTESEGILEKHYAGQIVEFAQDRNGYFIVGIEGGEIVVKFYTKEGLPTEYEFRGTKAQVIYRKIMHGNLISLMDHAAYIGHELARAEIALKENKKFVQDEA
jgi:thymidylate synthase